MSLAKNKNTSKAASAVQVLYNPTDNLLIRLIMFTFNVTFSIVKIYKNSGEKNKRCIGLRHLNSELYRSKTGNVKALNPQTSLFFSNL